MLIALLRLDNFLSNNNFSEMRSLAYEHYTRGVERLGWSRSEGWLWLESGQTASAKEIAGSCQLQNVDGPDANDGRSEIAAMGSMS